MATAPARDTAATSADVVAYRLNRTELGDRPALLDYVLERDAGVILDVPAEDLVFVDPKATRVELAAIFKFRHPPSHSALTNLVCVSSPYSSSLPARYHVKLQREWYAGRDAQEVCEAARVLGKPVRVESTAYWRDRRRSLYTHECYLRETDNGSFVVYGPKIAARGLKRMAQRGNAERVTPYVTCSEFAAWARAMHDMNTAGGLVDIAGSDNYWGWKRHVVVHRVHRDLALFELLYGRGAYWQLKEFRTLIETWKEKGPATWTAFGRALLHGQSNTYRDVFLLLDEEVDRKRKPRKRELKLRLPKGYRWK